MYRFLSCTVFFHLLSFSPFSPFSFIFLSCYFSCNVLSPLLSFSRFFPIPFFTPPPLLHLYNFLTFYLLTPPHPLRFSIFFSFFPRVFIFPSISNPCQFNFFLFSVCLSRFSISCFSSLYLMFLLFPFNPGTLYTKRIEYILERNLLEKSVKRPFCCTVSILQVYFTYLCYRTFWALEYHFIENLKLLVKENQIMK